ncbi:MAG: MATE family efflux transporter, partial [Lachnospiraceae bacterium]|nr:MATE family efflux transporter [Lachnospiraceae bacterium]
MDLLNGSIGDKLLIFALPLAATGILQQLFNAADVAVVGQFAGKNAMAAVGSNASLISLLVNSFTGISMGANVVISR